MFFRSTGDVTEMYKIAVQSYSKCQCMLFRTVVIEQAMTNRDKYMKGIETYIKVTPINQLRKL